METALEALTTEETPAVGPRVYAASDVAMLTKPVVGAPRVIPTPLDPLRSFESDNSQQQTDLKLFHTMRVEDRVSRLAEMEANFQTEFWRKTVKENDPVAAFKVRESRWRSYSYLIWLESKPKEDGKGNVIAGGNRDLALKITELLFSSLRAKAPANEASAIAKAAEEAAREPEAAAAFQKKVKTSVGA